MGHSLLIVDDNLSLANLYQIVFERSGWRARIAASGPEALDSIADHAPDVVLLDVMMPAMDGIEVCRRIRGDHPSPPPYIVIYTANNRPEVLISSKAAGADLFLSKTMSVFDLPARIIAELPPLDGS
jgi:two-component system OmpR family response regulator